MNGVVVKRYRPGDEEGIAHLFTTVFGKKMTLDFWRWKFLSDPDGIVNITVAADENGCIIGHYGGVVTRFHYQGEMLKAVQGVDIMVEPTYRTTPIFTLMYRAYLSEIGRNGLAFYYGFPSRHTVEVFAGREYYGFSVPIHEWVYQVGRLEELSYRFGFWRRLNSKPPLSLRLVKRFGDEVDQLWEELKSDYPCAGIRDSRYLNWRYVDQPACQYDIVYAENRSLKELVGFAVFKTGETNVNSEDGLILEVLASRKDGCILRSLLEFAIRYFALRGKKRIVAWFPESAMVAEQAKITGFHQNAKPRPSVVAVFYFDPSIVSPAFLKEHFYYTMGDSDRY